MTIPINGPTALSPFSSIKSRFNATVSSMNRSTSLILTLSPISSIARSTLSSGLLAMNLIISGIASFANACSASSLKISVKCCSVRFSSSTPSRINSTIARVVLNRAEAAMRGIPEETRNSPRRYHAPSPFVKERNSIRIVYQKLYRQ